MFRRFSTSWELVKASYQVLRSDKQLMVFPIVSSILTLIVAATFIVPVIVYFMMSHQTFMPPSGGRYVTHQDGGSTSPLTYLITFAFYLSTYFVILFSNVALISAAIIRLRGGSASVADGFRVAWSRVGSIFGYAMIAATVGMVLRTIQERVGLIGRIITGLLGVAWSVATFLVAPVLVAENPGAFGAVKRSTALLKQTWGEQIVGTIGINLVFNWIMVLFLLVCVPIIIGGAAAESVALAIAGGVFLLVGMLVLALIQSTLTGIYTAAVYLYACEGYTSPEFDREMIQGAFRTKGR
jgi:hypothetical protein